MLVVLVAFGAGELQQIDTGLSIPLLLIDSVYGLTVYAMVIADGRQGADRDPGLRPEPPRAVARIR